MLNHGSSLLDDLFIMSTVLLQAFDLCLSRGLLFHRDLNQLHGLFGSDLTLAQQFLLSVRFFGKFVNLSLRFLKLFETGN